MACQFFLNTKLILIIKMFYFQWNICRVLQQDKKLNDLQQIKYYWIILYTEYLDIITHTVYLNCHFTFFRSKYHYRVSRLGFFAMKYSIYGSADKHNFLKTSHQNHHYHHHKVISHKIYNKLMIIFPNFWVGVLLCQSFKLISIGKLCFREKRKQKIVNR